MQLDYTGTVDPKIGREHIGFRVLAAPKNGKAVILRPGVNTLTAEDWGRVKGTKGTKYLIATGQLSVLSGKDGDDYDISKGKPHEAVKLVKRTTEPDTLRAWREQCETASGDAWVTVVEAIDKQLEEVTTDVDGNPSEQRSLEMAG